MNEKIEERVFAMSNEINRMSGVISQVSRTQDTMADIQKELVSLLRKHDHAETRIDFAEKEAGKQLMRIENLEVLTNDLRDHNTKFKERRLHFEWWLSNWKSVAFVMLILVAVSALLFPNIAGMLP